MPYEGLGARHNAVATKVVQHGAIVVEDHFPGTAFKSTNKQGVPYVDPLLDATLAMTQIIIGEPFVIQVGGMHKVPRTALPSGHAVGDPIWIVEADNTLSATGGAGKIKLGRIDSLDVPEPNFALINAEVRDTF